MNSAMNSDRTYERWIVAWQQGVDEFNEGHYWHAHEYWERGWTELPDQERLWLQAQIQIAAVLHLIQKKRFDPARRLAHLAIEKMQAVLLAGGLFEQAPHVEISVEKTAVDAETLPLIPILNRLMQLSDNNMTKMLESHRLRATLIKAHAR